MNNRNTNRGVLDWKNIYKIYEEIHFQHNWPTKSRFPGNSSRKRNHSERADEELSSKGVHQYWNPGFDSELESKRSGRMAKKKK